MEQAKLITLAGELLELHQDGKLDLDTLTNAKEFVEWFLVMKFPTAEVEKCKTCESEITESNPLIDAERYSVSDKFGYCESCYDPTPFYPPID
jgi:hypothetical protein